MRECASQGYQAFRVTLEGEFAYWTVLDDSQVEPLQLVPEALPKYVRAIAPLDVQVGVPFTVVVTFSDTVCGVVSQAVADTDVPKQVK